MRLTSLENIFEDYCEKHDHLKLLLSQWRFDKELISKALQNVSSIFPHYSRHDSSHSKQIIVNIERMLGDRIYSLTATDMWLILESAYCHDIGMVVTHKQIQDLDTPEFKTFVSDIAAQPDHELHDFAVSWIGGGATLPDGAKAQVFFNEYRQIVAEWYRGKHPENSARIVRDPLDEIGLSSPRNELLPRRLFGALAAICNAHGLPFDEVMQLPFSEAGMATEDCHPRYVAFLLRMADLLDVDDNRFCPVMMRMTGESLPVSSHAHLEKHQGIRHFRLDSERIKVEVVCPTPESYEIAHDWFKWLEREYHSQSQHWPKIVPNKRLGRLPTLSPPKVSLQKPYLILNEGRRPSFDLDQAAMLRILRGTGLYDSKLDSIREILQNAVDSTIVAIWQQHKDAIPGMNPGSEDLLALYDRNKICVDFGSSSSGGGNFSLTVKDSGTGISRSDLERMLKIGSSKKNTSRSRLIRSMPDWFRPSGNFGIGLQSISLLADRFTIVTKSRESHESFKITFNLTSGSSVIVESIDGKGVDYGATVSVDITIDDFPETISVPWGLSGGKLMEKMNGYDFTEPGSDLKIYEQVRIFDAISIFNAGSPIKISSSQHSLPSARGEIFFDRSESVCLLDVQFGYSEGSMDRTLFRGQPFGDLHRFLPLVSFGVDFYGYEAINFLAYSRGKILPQMRAEAREKIKRSLLRYIEENFSNFDEEQQSCAAAFYYLYLPNSEFIGSMRDKLMSYVVRIEGEGEVSLSSVMDRIKSKEIVDIEVRERSHRVFGSKDTAKEPRGDGTAVLEGPVADADLSLITLLGTEKKLYWQELVPCHGFSIKRRWSDEDVIPVDSMIIRRIMSGEGTGFEIGNRMLFPAWAQYRKLAVVADLKWVRVHSHQASSSEVIVLPYIFKHEGRAVADKSDNLIDWVFNNRKNAELTRHQISELYDGLIEAIDRICACVPGDG
ncbi:ATP-binding protein [Stenotrophomonas sp.]|uniref:HD domain-containing protein n=1 Tax=Stenotrophomonas sp. TaxID=69392 RepID=UPI0028A0EFBF|nr:ATP-binding protein [Stenotrophomonas sp.]